MGNSETNFHTSPNKGLCHTMMALPFALKSILRQKKNYGNSNIFHHICKKYIIFKKKKKKNLKKKPKSFKIS